MCVKFFLCLYDVFIFILGINRLVGDKFDEDQKVESTEQTETLDCGLVLRSIGKYFDNIICIFKQLSYLKYKHNIDITLILLLSLKRRKKLW